MAEGLMHITWPANEGAVLLWSQIVLAWVLCVYVLLGNEPIVAELGASAKRSLSPHWKRWVFSRAALLAVALLLISRWTGWGTISLLAVLSGCAIALPLLRISLATRSAPFGAELELGINLVVAIVTALIIGNPVSAPLRGIVIVPVTGDHLALAVLIAAILLFQSTGATHMVRGLLTKVGALPKKPGGTANDSDQGQVDIKEYNRGRVVGVIERLIMTVMVAVGAYSALMFLIGAKGLIRSKELEDHAFAEYFLIGTLASAAIAILFGLLIQGLTRTFW